MDEYQELARRHAELYQELKKIKARMEDIRRGDETGREQLTHETIERDTAAWLAAGNKIKEIPPGISAITPYMSELELTDLLNKNRARKGKEPPKIYHQPRGHRKKLPKNAYDLIGKKFFHLEVKERVVTEKGVGWICKCDCGGLSAPVPTNKLVSLSRKCCSKTCAFFQRKEIPRRKDHCDV